MQPDSEYHSFLVRLWLGEQMGGAGEPPIWKGDVLHIQSGDKWLLHNLEEVLVVLKDTLIDDPASDQGDRSD